jgi:hypothetical protein
MKETKAENLQNVDKNVSTFFTIFYNGLFRNYLVLQKTIFAYFR